MRSIAMSWTRMKRAGVGLSIIVALGMTVAAAEAAVGDVLGTVAVPAGALCAGGDRGTAVAVVPGGKVLFPQIPVLLVTSCQDKLFFLNPATNPAALVKTLTTSINPSGGWKALTFRADKGDLLACQQVSVTQTALYSIDFIPAPLNTVTDGLATLIRNGPTGSTCAGIAWDSSDKTIYQTGLNASNMNVVFHFGESQASALPSILASCLGAQDSLTGVAVAGTSLFVSCAGPIIGDEIRQGYKVNGALTRDINVSAPGSLAYDPVSVGFQFKDLIWTKDQNPAQLRAVEIPGGTSGQVLGAPVLFPAACPAGYPTGNADTDNDGLLRCWKDGTLWSDGFPGISFNGNWNGNPANRDVTLCVETNGTPGFQVPPVVPELLSECARPGMKDIFVEIDYMQFHKPDPVAISNVVTAFSNAPAPDAGHPTYPGPIRLHVQIDEQIPHVNATALLPCTPAPVAGDANFDTLKTQSFTPAPTPTTPGFGTTAERTGANAINAINAKSFSFHYALFVHNQSGTGNTASGCAEVGGNDLMVSLGSWGLVTQLDGTTHNAGTTDQQGGTFMHELGHNLGLRHGGDGNTNCKPNYQSVMNYALQTNSVITGRPLDYSRQLLATLNEASLDETAGLGPVPPVLGKVAFGPQAGIPSKAVVATVVGVSIDWSRNGTLSTVARDLDNLSIAGCPALSGTFPGNAETLTGFNDWANINLNFRASLDFAGGATSSIDENKQAGTLELTLDEALALSRDVIDIKPADKNNTIKRSDTPTVLVAIFSRRDDQGVLEFDARDLDPATIFLRGTGGATWALPVVKTGAGFQCKQQDVDKDGLLDLVCSFKFAANTLNLTETKAILEGTTFNGTYDFHSSDAIRVVP